MGLIRAVTPQDASQIAEIYRHYVLETTISFESEEVSMHDMCLRIENISAKYPYFVYEDDGVILGYCYVHEWKFYAAYRATLETTIYLRPGVGRKGIGTRLMHTLIEACRDAGYHALIACITADNDASIQFHKALGFTHASSFSAVGYKFGQYLDIVDYQLIL
ncbi:MAG: GNAT family N-acetyltransferase [Muribaculaceae bacterium]|nr:GNAT family N-acetyltransferase [Muribaculaceae bacterium]